MARRLTIACALLACAGPLALTAVAAAAERRPPGERTLNRGWNWRTEAAAPGQPQPAPLEESAPTDSEPPPVTTPPGPGQRVDGHYRRTRVPNVFDPLARPELYPGQLRRYRIRFRGPRTPRGFRWLIQFESVRRGAGVYLNGRRLGGYRDPYTPFSFEARGLRPGRMNTLVVQVDSRKDPRIPEGWWNWGGIVRPVRLIPVGTAHLRELGLMSRVRCRGPARSCSARLLIDALLERRYRRRIRPTLTIRMRVGRGREIRRRFRLPAQRRKRRRLQLSMRVPRPVLWAPERPALYRAQLELREGRRLVQLERRRVGLRQVEVKGGHLWLNNRPVRLRGASIHEDMPGRGAALTGRDMDRIVIDLKEVGANVTRAHYLMSEGLLKRLDRAGIMVWNQAPIWQRDHRANVLRFPPHRRRAAETVRRTVKWARSHASVITHSVANELTIIPDHRTSTRRFLATAARAARDLDPTLPISLDIKGRRAAPQVSYTQFDMLGLNTYFGWYRGSSDFNGFAPYLQEMRALYPRQALVVTEFGAEALPEMRNHPADEKGSFLFQAGLTRRTLQVIDASPQLSGALYWTLREFEIFPGWRGGAPRRPGPEPNTRHHKGLMTYHGEKKPAWHVTREHFARTPVYFARRGR